MSDSEQKLEAILSRLNLRELKKSEKDKYLLDCPFAKYRHTGGEDSHPSAVLFFDSEQPLFFCSACRTCGTLLHILKDLSKVSGDSSYARLASDLETLDLSIFFIIQKLESLDSRKLYEVPEKQSIISQTETIPALESERAVQYLTSRGISLETIAEYSLLYDPLRFRVVFPRIIKGQKIPAVGRDITGKSAIRYYNYIGTSDWVGGLFSEDRVRLFIVEGFFDLLKCAPWAKEVSADVVCTWKCCVSTGQIKQLSCYNRTCYVWYDSDLAGNNGAKRAIEKLKTIFSVVKRVRPPLGSDVGELTKSQFLQLFEEQKNGFSARIRHGV